MKTVSFEVAKAIKNAGYPQTINSISSECYLPNGQLYTSYIDATVPLQEFHEMKAVSIAPTYLDVWLWLWKEKKIYIQVGIDCCTLSYTWGDSCTFKNNSDPEEAIKAAIEYLVRNNLIK